jgi:hypothetical protein
LPGSDRRLDEQRIDVRDAAVTGSGRATAEGDVTGADDHLRLIAVFSRCGWCELATGFEEGDGR